MLAPLVVAMLEDVLGEAAERAARDGALSPRLLLLLDETANIAPLKHLPKHLAVARGHGVRIVTVWQDLGQLEARFGEAAESVLANSQAKLFLGPITDQRTRRYVTELVGEEAVTSMTRTTGARGESSSVSTGQTFRPAASAGALQQLQDDRALLVHTDRPPAILRLSPWWAEGELVARSEGRRPADED